MNGFLFLNILVNAMSSILFNFYLTVTSVFLFFVLFLGNIILVKYVIKHDLLTSQSMLHERKYFLLNGASAIFLGCPCFTILDLGSMRKKYPNFLVKYLSLSKPKIKPGYF